MSKNLTFPIHKSFKINSKINKINSKINSISNKNKFNFNSISSKNKFNNSKSYNKHKHKTKSINIPTITQTYIKF